MKDRHIVITGASRGLGLACRQAFELAGASVFAPTREFADLANPGAPGRIAEAVPARWEHVDALINNAAIQGPEGPLEANDEAEWERCLRVNLFAPVMLCRALLPLMRPGSAIVNLSGGGATSPRPNFTAYATAKAGLVRFTETLAAEVAPRGIRVNAVAPGKMNTGMLPPGETGADPARACALITWLISPASAHVSGRLVSAEWDHWDAPEMQQLDGTDIFTLRRITPADRGQAW
jgi:NAD(P)-dependent dehydrogenase (short-subunit alcohol dehydrogenase family)